MAKPLRNNECFRAMAEYLVSHGYRFEPAFGGKHPYLLVDVGGSMIKQGFPLTASDHRSARNCVSDLRRKIGERERRRGAKV